MKDYTSYICAAYALAALVMGGMALGTWLGWKKTQRRK